MTALEKAAKRDFPGFAPLYTSRGTSAIYLALKAIEAESGTGEVVIPATVCTDVPFAVTYAGFRPRFCDVSLETFCATPDSIMAVVGPDTRAVIAVHLFGKSVAMPELVRVARSKGVPIIEDIAQAVGGEVDGHRVGSFGDFAVISFDDKKILPGRGGLLLARNPRHLEAARLAQLELPESMALEARKAVSVESNRVARELADQLRAAGIQGATDVLMKNSERFRHHYLFRPSLEEATDPGLARAWGQLAEQREIRQKNYQAYAEHLSEAVKYVRFGPAEMCWRLPLLVRDHAAQKSLIGKLRALGALVSDHYFPASRLFGDRSCPNAREIGLRAVNLCVDASSDPRLVPAVCQEINRTAV